MSENLSEGWQPIETAPTDERTVIVGVDIADEWIVRAAFYRSAELISQLSEHFGPDAWDETGVGWWSYKNSVTQERLEGIYTPTHWMPMPAPPNVDNENATIAEIIQSLRAIAEPAGPLHSYWDVILDGEALLAGQRSTASSTPQEWIAYSRKLL